MIMALLVVVVFGERPLRVGLTAGVGK